ncbi:baseplate assembly protein [Paenibacillus glufosinatiresistens]|uniref:baseplate assembly protein n=1 Tax=Paenibacillus glufosinatiresistens TaxID=3070657 RepID=UPI00286D95E5|nr:baseplate J/gp47 family protein [Paenibacillus sp. YX.27]
MVERLELPEIAFADEDATSIKQNIVSVYEGLTGRTLAPGDPVQLFLMSLASILIQQRVLINRTAKGNLLRYASGSLLDHMGAFQGSARLPAAPAITTLEFTLSIPLSSVTPIPAGTRVGPTGGDGSIYFETNEYMEIPAGSVSGRISASCSVLGIAGNGFLPGQINVLMDPLPFVQSVANLTSSSGGAAAESDDDYRERIRSAPESYSTAGPQGAYEYWVKASSSAVLDVHAFAPEGSAGGEVQIVPLLTGGQIPDRDVLDAIAAALEDRGIRPLTDKVTVTAPKPVPYEIRLTYYIARSRAAEVTAIRAAVQKAVANYQLWQKSRLGRDINPSELVARIMQAGALRVEVEAPDYLELTPTEVAQESGEPAAAEYGGLADD